MNSISPVTRVDSYQALGKERNLNIILPSAVYESLKQMPLYGTLKANGTQLTMHTNAGNINLGNISNLQEGAALKAQILNGELLKLEFVNPKSGAPFTNVNEGNFPNNSVQQLLLSLRIKSETKAQLPSIFDMQNDESLTSKNQFS